VLGNDRPKVMQLKFVVKRAMYGTNTFNRTASCASVNGKGKNSTGMASAGWWTEIYQARPLRPLLKRLSPGISS
jgi:hypothetical protein